MGVYQNVARTLSLGRPFVSPSLTHPPAVAPFSQLSQHLFPIHAVRSIDRQLECQEAV